MIHENEPSNSARLGLRAWLAVEIAVLGAAVVCVGVGFFNLAVLNSMTLVAMVMIAVTTASTLTRKVMNVMGWRQD